MKETGICFDLACRALAEISYDTIWFGVLGWGPVSLARVGLGRARSGVARSGVVWHGMAWLGFNFRPVSGKYSYEPGNVCGFLPTQKAFQEAIGCILPRCRSQVEPLPSPELALD
jgi:hypothetical protein